MKLTDKFIKETFEEMDKEGTVIDNLNAYVDWAPKAYNNAQQELKEFVEAKIRKAVEGVINHIQDMAEQSIEENRYSGTPHAMNVLKRDLEELKKTI